MAEEPEEVHKEDTVTTEWIKTGPESLVKMPYWTLPQGQYDESSRKKMQEFMEVAFGLRRE